MISKYKKTKYYVTKKTIYSKCSQCTYNGLVLAMFYNGEKNPTKIICCHRLLKESFAYQMHV